MQVAGGAPSAASRADKWCSMARWARIYRPSDFSSSPGNALLTLFVNVTQCMVRPCGARGFVDLADAVLHQCIRPLLGARCAPGHHGYQRACELVTGQASIGPLGSPVFACAGKTDPPSSSRPLADLGGQTEIKLRHR